MTKIIKTTVLMTALLAGACSSSSHEEANWLNNYPSIATSEANLIPMNHDLDYDTNNNGVDDRFERRN